VNQIRIKDNRTLIEKYPPSESCSCKICTNFCIRPGWWTVEEAKKAIEAGLSYRMMLEIPPEYGFGVLSPAFKGNETNYALQINSKNGCTFLKNNLCELYEKNLMPLECRFCHHSRPGQGLKCHLDIEKEWHTANGKKLIIQWGNKTGFWQRQGLRIVEK
jgi:hypothetical protein